MTLADQIKEQISNFEQMLRDDKLTPESRADKHGNIHGLNIALHLLEGTK